MALLTAEQVKSAETFKTVDVEVPEWGGSVRLKALTAADALEFLEFSKQLGNTNKSMLVLVQMSCVDEQGNKLFQDEKGLEGKSLSVLLRLQREAITLNGFRKEVTEFVKNALSEAAREGSPTASPSS